MQSKLLFYLMILMVLLISRCSIDEPVLPRWSTQFLVPLMTEKIIFADKFANDTTVVVKGDSLYLELDGDFDPDTLRASDLRIPGADSTATFSLKKIEMDSLNTITTGDILVTDLLPYLSLFTNQTIQVPDTTIHSSFTISDSSAFISMQVKSGIVNLSIYNNLPLTIAPAIPGGNSVEISVYNAHDGSHVTDIAIADTIAPGESGSGSGMLGSGDGWVEIPLDLDSRVHFLSESIFVASDSLNVWSFRADLNFRNLEVDEITGNVSSQTFEDTLHIGLEQEDHVIEAVIESGSIELFFQNRLPVVARVHYTLPDLRNGSTGLPYEAIIEIQPNDSASQHIQNLQGYIILNSQNQGQPLDTLTIFAEASTDPGNVTLKKSDEVAIRVRASELFFSSLEGILAPDTLSLDPFVASEIVDYEGFDQGFKLKGVQLLLSLENGLIVENLSLSGRIVGYKLADNGQILDSAEFTIESTELNTGSNILQYEGQDVDDLVNIFPTDLKAEAQIEYSGYARVTAGDVISGHYIFSTPFQVNVVQQTDLEIDPDTLREVDEDFKEAARENLKNARLNARIINSSPLSGEIQIFFSRDFTRKNLYDTTAYFNPEKEFIKSVILPEAQVDPVTGFVLQSAEREIVMNLSQNEIGLFGYPPLRVGLLLRLKETNGFVIVRGSDFVSFSGNIETEMVIKDNSYEYK
ncbi:MAG: hypothetical protein EH225_09995 [Calditrichaeota bacterium]|nr:hypothetical protein [Calditrichota bacterium]RQW00952.1 MAG: hypothetical protein EH225_09995 [Calditrichota bacterium]